MLAIIILTDPNDDKVYLPLEANLDRGNFDSFIDLKNKWESQKWGCYHKISVSLGATYTNLEAKEIKRQGVLFPELVSVEPLTIQINDPESTVICDETDVVCFAELAIANQWYYTPYDEKPHDFYFMSCWAADCYKGSEYSKDYGYKTCPCCGRTICEQNPDNGWVGQFRSDPQSDPDNDWADEICSQCFEEEMFESGVNIDKMLETQHITGSWYSSGELEDAGFEKSEDIDDYLVGSGMNANNPEQNFFNKIRRMKESGDFNNKIVLFEYGSVAMGGFGGYVTMWYKNKAS